MHVITSEVTTSATTLVTSEGCVNREHTWRSYTAAAVQRVSRGFLARCAARGAVVEVAVEAATGGAGASAPTAAEWDDRGEHDYRVLL